MTEPTKNTPAWDAEAEHPDICAKIRDSLRTVRDPELGMDLIQLGLVRNVSFGNGKLKIEMILTTPYCPYAPMLMEMARRQVETATNFPTEVTYGEEIWDQSMMEEGSSFNWGLF